MAYVLGIDIGTSYTAAAVARWEGDTPAPPQVLCLGTRQAAVPSVIFLGDDGQVLVGEAAERRAMTQPECVVRAFKRRVGDAVPIVAGAGSITPTDALALMARWVVDRAQASEGAAPELVTLTHPAGWGAHKLGLLQESLATVGLAGTTLLNEPEAAARHYASQQRVEAGSTVAVYDLGGGTFDAVILRKDSADSFEVLGRPEGIEWLGGADFDDAVFGHVAAGPDAPLAGLDLGDPDVLMALSRVRRECTEAKEALSYDSEASIPVLLPGRQTRIRLVRQEFEAQIEGLVRLSIDTLDRTLQAAHVDPADLAVILLVGGSSRVPLIAQLLSAEFNRPIAVDVDPKASVCLGAACSAAARLSRPEVGAGHGPDDEGIPETVLSGPGHRPGPRRVRRPSSRRPGGATSRPPAAPAVAPDAWSGTRLRRRLTAVGVTLAALTVLTATTAQTPSGLDPAAPLAAAARVGTLAEGLLSPAWRLPAQEASNRLDADGATLAVEPGGQLPGAMDDEAAPADPSPEAAASDAPSTVPETREEARTGTVTRLPGPQASPRATRTPTTTPGHGGPSPAVPGATRPQSPVTGPGPEAPAPTQKPPPTPTVTPPTPGPVTSPPAPEPEPTPDPTPDATPESTPEPTPTAASPGPVSTEGFPGPASTERPPVSDSTASVPAPAAEPSASPGA
jgi:molecular chaperone DnaK